LPFASTQVAEAGIHLPLIESLHLWTNQDPGRSYIRKPLRDPSFASFPNDKRKIAFIISQLSGKALEWAEARFLSESSFSCTFEQFFKEFSQVFNQDSDQCTEYRGLLDLKQGNRTVADFSIDFQVKAAASGWNEPAKYRINPHITGIFRIYLVKLTHIYLLYKSLVSLNANLFKEEKSPNSRFIGAS
uniref:Ty3 transposon capsid-like protein domain-containing protein n=1 Tax=Cyprinodon variegatus TaxID=28743 RepID=A0A3Q2GBW8_CYPVA